MQEQASPYGAQRRPDARLCPVSTIPVAFTCLSTGLCDSIHCQRR